MLWLICISLNQSESSSVALSPGCSDSSLAKQCWGGTCSGHGEMSAAIKMANSPQKKELQKTTDVCRLCDLTLKKTNIV